MTDTSRESTRPGASCSTRSATWTRRSSRVDRAVADDRHVADGYRALATTLGVAPRHLPVRRAEPADLHGDQHAVPPRPALGRRQHRRLLPDRAGRPGAPLPDLAATAATRLLRAHRLQRARPGRVVGPGRAAPHDSRPGRRRGRRFSFEIGPVPDVAGAGRPATTRSTRCAGRPVTWHIEALEEPDPIRHGDAETAAALRATARLAAHDVRDHPARRRRPRRRRSTPSATRSRTPPTSWATPYQVPDSTSAGRPATRATPSAASTSPRTRRW